MSNSVTLSIITNSLITGAKAFGWFVTGSPTLFAETVHSCADVGNQLLLKVGEVRADHTKTATHPFGRGQKRFFWALVSAVSIFFVGAGVTIYHGIQSLLVPASVEPFTPLAVGLLLFSLALELFTFFVALKEIGGFRGLRENRSNTSVLAVLLEDLVAVIGILLTLFVAGWSSLIGPDPVIDASVSLVVGVMLGAMALFLANINGRILIDAADVDLDRALEQRLVAMGVRARVASITFDVDRAVVFVHAEGDASELPRTAQVIGDDLCSHADEQLGKHVDSVYWQFAGLRSAAAAPMTAG